MSRPPHIPDRGPRVKKDPVGALRHAIVSVEKLIAERDALRERVRELEAKLADAEREPMNMTPDKAPSWMICPAATRVVYGTKPGDRRPREVPRTDTLHDPIFEAKGPILCRWCGRELVFT